MKVLALEPYFGGSHAAFLTGWAQVSAHTWTVLQLPPYTWKWRMRHAAITFAEDLNKRIKSGASWDSVLCSDMLNLAEFKGLVDSAIATLPSVCYFHENQLTYPTRHAGERDHHFAFTNMVSGLAADAVWFNSHYHRDVFLDALAAFLQRMPDHQPVHAVDTIRNKSSVWPQGLEPFPARGPRPPGPLRILWAARWEHDKNPELFFEALDALIDRNVDFRISVVGEQFENVPAVFERARARLVGRIDHWGYLAARADYRAALVAADVAVSTADHEFFGISMAEALAAGAYPLLPNRLAYPELVADFEDPQDCLYDGSAAALSAKLTQLAQRVGTHGVWPGAADRGREAMARYGWTRLGPRLDAALSAVRTTS